MRTDARHHLERAIAVPLTAASRCDQCGAVVTDVDAGFSPALHGMRCDCGGTWRGATYPMED